MKEIKVTAWQTNSGEIYYTEEEAIAHEREGLEEELFRVLSKYTSHTKFEESIGVNHIPPQQYAETRAHFVNVIVRGREELIRVFGKYPDMDDWIEK